MELLERRVMGKKSDMKSKLKKFERMAREKRVDQRMNEIKAHKYLERLEGIYDTKRKSKKAAFLGIAIIILFVVNLFVKVGNFKGDIWVIPLGALMFVAGLTVSLSENKNIEKIYREAEKEGVDLSKYRQ